MVLGVDFDNTIVRYDELFHSVAVERGLIPATLPARKKRSARLPPEAEPGTGLDGIAGLRLRPAHGGSTAVSGRPGILCASDPAPAAGLHHQPQDPHGRGGTGVRFTANRPRMYRSHTK